MHIIPTQEEVVAVLRETGALRDGHFEYPSGLHSNEYLQVPLAMRYYQHQRMLSVGLSRLLRANPEIRAIVPELSIVVPMTGGLPVAYGVTEALRPIRRRTELLSGAVVPPQLIIGRTLLRIAQHFVRLLNLFELVLGVLLFTNVGVEFARQLAIGTLHPLGVGIACYPQNLVIILVLHAHLCAIKSIDYRHIA